MAKRGQATVLLWKLVIEILIGLLVAGILIYSAYDIDAVSTFNKEYIEQDVGLLANTMLASPGEITVIYPVSEGYNVELTDDEVEVTREDIKTEMKDIVLSYNGEVLSIE